MGRAFHLRREQLVPRPRAEVFPFFVEAENLEAITPDFLGFHIETPQPIAIQAGCVIDYRLRLFGVPLLWRTLIESFDPPHEFVDVQVRGPYRRWRHRHRFEETASGTRIIDEVEYQLPFGWLGALAHPVFVRPTLNRIFDYRQQQIAEQFGRSAAT